MCKLIENCYSNVNELVQDNPEMAVTSSLSDQRYKRLEYDYDLISGKVNRVSYQRGERDAWHHWYEYDADNRITQVYTSTHPDPMAMAGERITNPTVVSALWEEDSKYFYYAHGPLMRQELGSNQVQGVDYAYTLQGWIKGINSNALDVTKDMGHDGSGTGLNGRFARDVASFSLSYYEGDFSSVSSTGAFSSVVGSDLEAESRNLYNGNIRIMQTTLMENNGSGGLTASNLGMAYKYDQLNRLKQAKGFTQYAPSTNSWSASSGAAGEHNNFFTFDANGNILTQQRYEGSTLVDSLTYHYATNNAGQLLSNRLYSVDDSVTVASLSATDMEDMPLYNNASPNASNNYKYTQIGELKSDNQEEIQEIHWRVDSKISEITRTSGSVKKNLKFEYDAMGNRVAKHVYAGSVLESSTYYVRDAQGNVMGVYEHKMDAENAVLEYRLIERNIYGSAQVGICKDTVDLNITNAAGALTQATYYHARQLNHRQYSLSNHLGNVLTTIGDGKAATDNNSDGVIDYYTAYIISVSDYSPFGVELANRSWSIEEYRNGFNGKEKVDEITGNSSDYDFGARIYDARIGRWMSVDPMEENFPNQCPYNYCFNNPINFIDPTGMAPDDWVRKDDGNMVYDSRVIDQKSATDLYGDGAQYREVGYTYTSFTGENIELGDYGFFKSNGDILHSADLAEEANVVEPIDNSGSIMKGGVAASCALLADDITVVGVADDVAIIPVLVVTGIAAITAKATFEISQITERNYGPLGFQYALTAKVSGYYPVYTFGNSVPTGTKYLNKDDVWKYGETTSSSRYDAGYLDNIGPSGVTMNPQFFGNQMQIKIAEKSKIYSYYLTHGELPPGNKIFR